MNSKPVSYKGAKANLPENLSIRLFKRVINECGDDYSIKLQDVLNLLSSVIATTQTNIGKASKTKSNE
jgi:hypothetical protein